MTFTIKQLYLDANLHAHRTISDIKTLERIAQACWIFIDSSLSNIDRFFLLKKIGRLTTSLKRKYHDVRLTHSEVPWSYFDLLATLTHEPAELMPEAEKAVQSLLQALSPQGYRPDGFLLKDIMSSTIKYIKTNDENIFNSDEEKLAVIALKNYLTQRPVPGATGYLHHETMVRLMHQLQVQEFVLQFCETESALLHCQLELQNIYFDFTRVRNETVLEEKHRLFKKHMGAIDDNKSQYQALVSLGARVNVLKTQLDKINNIDLISDAAYIAKFNEFRDKLSALGLKVESFFQGLVNDLHYYELLQVEVFLSRIHHSQDASQHIKSITALIDTERCGALSDLAILKNNDEKSVVIAQKILGFLSAFAGLSSSGGVICSETVKGILSEFNTRESVLEDVHNSLNTGVEKFIAEILSLRLEIDATDISSELAGSYRGGEEISVKSNPLDPMYTSFQTVLNPVFLSRWLQVLDTYSVKLRQLLELDNYSNSWAQRVAMLNCMVIIGETFKELVSHTGLSAHSALISPFIALRSAILHAVHESSEQRQALFSLVDQAPKIIFQSATEYLSAVQFTFTFFDPSAATSSSSGFSVSKSLLSEATAQAWDKLKNGDKVDEEALLYPLTSVNFLLDQISSVGEDKVSHDAAGLVLAWVGQLALDVTEKSYVHGRTLSRRPGEYEQLIKNLGYAASLRANFCHGFAERLYQVQAGAGVGSWGIDGCYAALGFLKSFREQVGLEVFLKAEGGAYYRRVLHDVSGNDTHRAHLEFNNYLGTREAVNDVTTRPTNRERIRKMLAWEQQFLSEEKNVSLVNTVCESLNEMTEAVVSNSAKGTQKELSPVSVVQEIEAEKINFAFAVIFNAYKAKPWRKSFDSAEKARMTAEGFNYFSRRDLPSLTDQFARLMYDGAYTPEKSFCREVNSVVIPEPLSASSQPAEVQHALFLSPVSKKSGVDQPRSTGAYARMLERGGVLSESSPLPSRAGCFDGSGNVATPGKIGVSPAFYSARGKTRGVGGEREEPTQKRSRGHHTKSKLATVPK